jgi:dihydropteroate synthase
MLSSAAAPSILSTVSSLDCGTHSLDLSRTAVMGILNVTPDSFSDGGAFLDRDNAIEHGIAMAAHGAAVIDVGGESTRPGARPVSAQEEIDRVVPVIERLAAAVSIPLSIDTSKPDVMRAAVAAGAGLINDVRALSMPGALEAAALLRRPVVLMHMQGSPSTMQAAPRYGDVVRDVRDFLATRIDAAVAAGIARERIVVDPGFGFGKTAEHNLQLLRRLRELLALGPILAGVSRKSMIGTLLGLPVERRLQPSVALALIAVQNGARIVRVHDVAATVEALRMFEAVYPDRIDA